MGKNIELVEKAPLRVCIVNEFFFPDCEGGTGQTVSEIARKLCDAGVNVSVVCGARSYRSSKPLASKDNWDGVSIRRVRYPNWNRTSVLRRSLCNILFAVKAGITITFSKRYDAVLVTTAPPFAPMAAQMVRILRGTPYAYLIYDLEPNRIVALQAAGPQSLPVKMLHAAQTKWMNRAGTVIPIGRCMKSLIKRDYGVTEENLSIVPVGSNIETIAYLTPNSLNGRPFRLLYSGNLGRYHDFDALLDCAKELSQENFEFRIVGRGAKRDHVEQRIRTEGITNVRLDDFVSLDSYSSLLAWADACYVSMERGIEGTCVPSKSYSIMAAGRAIVASAAKETELAYAVNDHQCGVVVEPGNSAALVEALRNLQRSSDLAETMGLNGRRAFEQLYTTETTVEAIRRILYRISAVLAPAAAHPVAMDEKDRLVAADPSS